MAVHVDLQRFRLALNRSSASTPDLLHSFWGYGWNSPHDFVRINARHYSHNVELLLRYYFEQEWMR